MEDKTKTPVEYEDNRSANIDVIPLPVHPKKAKIANLLAAISLVIVAVSLSIIIKWSFASSDILVIKNSPFPTRILPDPDGKTGGIVDLTIDYCKNTTDTGTIRMSYVSASREILVPVVEGSLPYGCRISEIPVVVPLGLPHDEYKIKFHVVYDLNPIKKNVSVDFESQKFTVGSFDSD